MDLLRKYLIPVFEAPDAAPGAEPPAAPPQVPAVAAEPGGGDGVPAPDAPPAPAPKMVSVDVMIREVTPLRAKAREAEERAQRAEREAAESRALLERLQTKAAPDTPPRDPASGRFTPPPAPAAPDDTEVSRRAAELVFQRDAQRVSETGFKTYGQGWVDAVNALNAYGINSSEFVGSVMEIDQARAHEIMHTIAQDGERAIALANMSPARRIAEIAKIAMTPEPAAAPPAAPPAPAKTVSKAPAPPPPVDPSASKVVDGYSDDATDEQFTAQFNARMKERAGMRR